MPSANPASMPTPETTLLKPKPSNLTDANEWPDFQLTNVEVLDPETSTPTSLLTADETSPLTVIGTLPKSKDRTQHLRDKRFNRNLPCKIAVENVQTFSYGQDDAGNIILWAAGSAGWFELSPSSRYRAQFSSDCEAVGCLYFLADLYRSIRGVRNRREYLVEKIWKGYSEELRHKCKGPREAEEVFARHKTFLLGCMEVGKEGVNWPRMSIWEHLRVEVEEEEVAENETYVEADEGEAMVVDPDEPSVLRTPAQLSDDPRQRHAGKGRSTLRPKSKKHSQKGPGKRQSSDSEGGSAAEEQSPSAPPFATTPSVPLKRKTASNGRSLRSRHLEEQAEEGTDPASSEQDTAEDEDEAADAPGSVIRLPIKKPRPKPRNARSPAVKIKTYPLPTSSATLPGDVWACPFDGCNNRVYAASSAESKQLIREHYQSHAYGAQQQLDLVYKEERPYLPVGRLVEKIREMAAQKPVAAPSGGGTAGGGIEQFLPKPIEQRY